VEPSHQVVYAGNTATLECTGGEFKYWKFKKILDVRASIQNKSKILIPEASKFDAGAYTCFAEVTADVYSATAELYVAGTPLNS